jgi:pimeloyl-ACP methyl ester carboxylesterase
MPDIAYWKEGKGKPLVLLPGFCETKEMWKSFVQPLLGKYELWCPDLPGFGDSPLPAGTFTLVTIANDLADWMLDNKIGDAAVIGHSLGGYLALEMARLPKLDLSGLGLFHSTAYPDSPDKKNTRDKTVAFVKKHGVQTFIQSSLPQLFSPQNRTKCQQDISSLLHFASQIPAEGIIGYTLAMRDRKKNMETLLDFQKPTIMICGEEDTAVPIADSLDHKDAVDQFHQIANCGHMGMFEQTQKSQEAVQAFMDSL